MSYQVLARKWRPQSFQELVGQEHVARALINALDQDRLHHAYLFTGTRGVGKTTIARILSKCLNCETGVSSQPCGVCTSCQEINEGRFIDLLEVDAASHTGVDNIREIIENAQYLPTRARYKVYLIDEVHMLSKSAFNALLKTLEEPPSHVKFLLATTDPQKLPVTVLSRCLQFSLKAMTPVAIVNYLKKILEQELISFDEAALWNLARSATGSMRDALSLTDQAIGFGGGKITETDVSTMLGSIDRGLVYRVMDGLKDGSAEACMSAVEEIAELSPDWNTVLLELSILLHRIALAQVVPTSIDENLGDKEALQAYAGVIPAEDVQLFYQIAITGRRDLALAPDFRSGFEMTLMRMVCFLPQAGPIDEVKKKPELASRTQMQQPAQSPTQSPAASTTEQSSQRASQLPTEQPPKRPQQNAQKQSLEQASGQQQAVQKAPAIKQTPVQPLDTPSPRAQSSASVALQKADQVETQQDNVVPLHQTELMPSMEDPWENEWADFLAASNLQGAALNLARNCSLEGKEEGGAKWILALESKNHILIKDELLDKIAEAVGNVSGTNSRIKIKQVDELSQTPEMLMAQRQQQRTKIAEQMLLTDNLVTQMRDEFQAELDRESVKAFDSKQPNTKEGE